MVVHILSLNHQEEALQEVSNSSLRDGVVGLAVVHTQSLECGAGAVPEEVRNLSPTCSAVALKAEGIRMVGIEKVEALVVAHNQEADMKGEVLVVEHSCYPHQTSVEEALEEARICLRGYLHKYH